MHIHMGSAVLIIVMVVWAIKSIRRNDRGERYFDPRAPWRGRRDWNGQDRNASAQPAPVLPDPILTREGDELRKRIAVLERIATDDRHGRKIAEEIEALRDPRPMSPASDFRVAPTSNVASDERR